MTQKEKRTIELTFDPEFAEIFEARNRLVDLASDGNLTVNGRPVEVGDIQNTTRQINIVVREGGEQ